MALGSHENLHVDKHIFMHISGDGSMAQAFEFAGRESHQHSDVIYLHASCEDKVTIAGH